MLRMNSLFERSLARAAATGRDEGLPETFAAAFIGGSRRMR